jgi:hypothetical protein
VLLQLLQLLQVLQLLHITLHLQLPDDIQLL